MRHRSIAQPLVPLSTRQLVSLDVYKRQVCLLYDSKTASSRGVHRARRTKVPGRNDVPIQRGDAARVASYSLRQTGGFPSSCYVFHRQWVHVWDYLHRRKSVSAILLRLFPMSGKDSRPCARKRTSWLGRKDGRTSLYPYLYWQHLLLSLIHISSLLGRAAHKCRDEVSDRRTGEVLYPGGGRLFIPV